MRNFPLCGLCGFAIGTTSARVTVTRDGTRYKALRLCALCFADATVETVERNTTWSSVTFSLGRSEP